MTHKRQLIREAIAAEVDTVLSLTGRVFMTRTRRTAQSEMPVALIYTNEENSQQDVNDPRLLRDLSVFLELHIAKVEGIDETLDGLCEPVEAVIAANPRLGGLALNTVLARTRMGYDGEGDEKHGVAILTFEVMYRT
jgi:hypothetical protein